jgi:glutathione S-transferase
MPQSPRELARVTQIMRIMDHYAYPSLVWGLYVEEVQRDRAGKLSQAEVARAENVLKVLDGLMAQPYFLGDGLTLADLWAAPMLAYLELAPTGHALLSKLPNLRRWSALMRGRPSLQATRFPKETD